MSLQVWLPLNGTLENLGLSDVTVTNNGATVNTSGKIGSCYSFDGSDDYIQTVCTDYPSILQGDFSIAFWIYNNDSGGRSVLFGNFSLTGSWLNIEKTTSEKLRFYWNEAKPDWNPSNTSIPVGVWSHVIFTRSGNNIKFYINGALTDSLTYSMSSSVPTNATTFYLGRDARTGATTLNGKLNDFRIYDHCLSQKEVKELSKGLIGHWPLNDYHSAGPINKYSSPYSDGELSASSWTKTKLADERGWNYKLTRTGTGTNVWANGAVPNFTFTVGKTYYYSVKVRCHKWSVGALALRAARCNNDWATRSINVCEPSKADGKWHEYYTYQTIPESFDRSGTTVTSNPVLEFYSSAQGTEGTVYDMDFDIKDIQVVESDSYLPFIDNAITDTTIYDCSGYGRNGSVSANPPTIDSDSIRYSVCNKFNGSNNFIILGRDAMVKDEITVNAWAYMSDWSTYNSRIISCTEGGGWNFEPASGKINFSIGTGTSSNTYKSAASATTILTTLSSGWHMFTGTYDGLASKVYVDAVLQGTNSAYTTKTPIFYNASNGIFIGAEAAGNQTTPAGNYFNGKISDVRIYATALSADDIKELYETSASVDNNGNWHCYEISEL